MKTEDVIVALEFLWESDQVVLQCASAQDIPYVKRAVHKLAGVPSKTIGNVLYYGKKKIHIACVLNPNDWYGFRESVLFYIGRENGSDLTLLEIGGIDLGPNDIR